MIETRLSQQQIETIIKLEKRGNVILKIFFGIWRLFGLIGILAAINNFINPPQPPTSDYEAFLNIFMLIVAIPIIAGFFWGIPFLIFHSIKKRERKLKNGDFKVYIGIVNNKHHTHNDRKSRYYVNVNGLDKYVKTSSMNYDTISIGQEVYVLQVGYEFSCYTYEYLNRCIEYVS